MESTKSYYLYELQEKYTGQDWMSVIPRTYSIDGNGTMPRILKSNYEEVCDNTDYSKEYLTFESLEDNNTIYLKAANTAITKTVSASTDNGATWTEYTSSTGGSGTTLATLNTGEKILLKGENSTYASSASSISNFNKFTSTGQFKAYGNIMSLVSGDSFANVDELTESYTFGHLFYNCSGLTSAENLVLPATTLTEYCYHQMFDSCRSLTTAPQLPATTLAKACYMAMFEYCSRLTTAPELPATTLVDYCYQGMFAYCTNLTTAPELPATTLAEYCYTYMFMNCSKGLTTAPELPATTLADYCYQAMFMDCTSLNYIKCLASDISASMCTSNWVDGVPTTGTFVKAASMTGWTRGKNGIPTGWTVQNA